jgi:uncharacterized membrane protein YbhN (UPF0104 family)
LTVEEERDERADAPTGIKRWATPLRIAVSVLLLGIIVWRLGDGVDWRHTVPDWSPEALAWMLGAALLMLVSYVLSTFRWQQVVRALDLRDRFQRLLSHFLAGQFVSNALPTTIGGDVVRVARLSKDTGDAPGSFASVVLERLSGWIVLPAITLIGFGLNPTLQHEGMQTEVAFAIAAFTLAALGGLVYAVNHQRVGGRFTEGEGWRRFAAAVHLGVARIRHHPASVLSILGAGFVYQFILVLAAYLAALALGIDIGITALMAFFPAVLIAQVIPISIAGLGVREFMLVWLLGSVGVPKEKALALGILIWALTVVTSLVGAPAYATGGGRLDAVSEDALA